MVRQGAVREPAPPRVIDHVDDPAGNQQKQAERKAEKDRQVRGDRTVRSDDEARPPVHVEGQDRARRSFEDLDTSAEPHTAAALTLTRASVLLAVVLLIVSMRNHPWWYQAGDSACDNPGMVKVDGRVTTLGGCDGNLADSRTVSVRPGSQIKIHMAEDESSSGLQPDVPLPSSSNITAVRLDGDIHGGNATYLAVGQGSATLLSTTQYCDRGRAKQRLAPCAVIHILVTR
jgi:hypothetical protein